SRSATAWPRTKPSARSRPGKAPCATTGSTSRATVPCAERHAPAKPLPGALPAARPFKEHSMKPNTRYSALAAALLASTLVVACGDREDATVGQRLDGAVNDVQQASKEMREDAGRTGQDMKEAGNNAA